MFTKQLSIKLVSLFASAAIAFSTSQNAVAQIANKPKWKLKGHKNEVASVAFSPDGLILATGDRDGTIIFWDTRTGKLRQQFLKKNQLLVYKISFWPDGETVTSVDAFTILLWEVETGEQKQKIFVDNRGISLSPDGKTIAAWYDTTLMLYDGRTGMRLQKLVTKYRINNAIFSPNAKMLAATGRETEQKEAVTSNIHTGITELKGEAILWDLQKRQKLGSIEYPNESMEHITFSQDGRMIAIAGVEAGNISWAGGVRAVGDKNHIGKVRVFDSLMVQERQVLQWEARDRCKIGAWVHFLSDNKTIVSTGLNLDWNNIWGANRDVVEFTPLDEVEFELKQFAILIP